jgi:hypothetical protein
LPPLPEVRYAGTMQLLQGRLHFIGGAQADRYTPADDHWSIAVNGAEAEEESWRVETPIPRAGMHRASVVVGEALYVFGGQEGDFTPVPGDSLCTCNPFTVEHIYGDAFRWNAHSHRWDALPPMPIPASHIECSVAVYNDQVWIAGGTIFKDPDTFDIQLTDAIQCFDLKTQRWTIQGYLPYRLKTAVVAIHSNWLYVTTGQRDQSVCDARPGAVESRTWRARLPLS